MSMVDEIEYILTVKGSRREPTLDECWNDLFSLFPLPSKQVRVERERERESERERGREGGRERERRERRNGKG